MRTDYKGSELSQDQAWMLEVEKVPQELRDNEPELRGQRWFDYRHLIPAQATYLFAHEYKKAYKAAYERTRDIERAGKINSPLTDDVFEGAELIPIWRARQSADMIGCKYGFYLSFIFNRFNERGSRYLPRPNQLYSEELVLDIEDSWNLAKDSMLVLADSEWYREGEYVGHPDQDDYHAYLIEQIKKRQHQHMVLSRLVFKQRVLPLEVACRHFKAELIERAESN